MKLKIDQPITRYWRHKIYKKALEVYISDYSSSIGLCSFLEMACGLYNYMWSGLYWKHRVEQMIEALPEFQAHKPLYITHDFPGQEFWWPLEDKESRIKVLKEMIELTR